LCFVGNQDKAFISLMVDSSVRNAEVRVLNWGDVDLASGIIMVKCGKGRQNQRGELTTIIKNDNIFSTILCISTLALSKAQL
jgi:site-specific recombinase XerC